MASDAVVDAVLALKRRVAELAARDPGRKVFGSRAHDYAFAKPLTEAKVAAFEKRWKITLPDDYRAFVTLVGRGGAGPAYGLFELGGKKDDDDLTALERLGAPFPHVDAHNRDDLLPTGDEDDEDSDDDPMLPYWESFSRDGMLYLCHHGCALRSFLVVTGKSRGQVWYDGTADSEGYSPHTAAAGARHTFLTWYASWLDQAFADVGR